MPTYYLLDQNEKNIVFKIREGIKPLSLEDHEKISERAEILLHQWARKPRGQMVMPQDGLDYWMAVATHEYIFEQLGIKID